MKTAVEFVAAGYADLVSVIPPKGLLSPASKIRPDSRGKAPGVLYASGLWGGYSWHDTGSDPARIDRDGANIGLRAHSFPAVDIDVKDEALASLIAAVVERVLPQTAMRVGQWPKRLLPFRLEGEAFSRMQLYIDYNDDRHLVEILGSGQQYLIGGIHPRTMEPYDWRRPLPASASSLPTITKAQAEGLLEAIQEDVCDFLGLSFERAGTGCLVSRRDVNQEALVAPDLDLLQTAVATIPNTAESFPSRADFIRFGYALRGATQSDPDKGLDIFTEWAVRASHVVNTPESVQREWDTLHGPYELGSDYVFDFARRFGFDMAVHEFPAEPAPVVTPNNYTEAESRFSDMWLKDQVISKYGGRIKYVPSWNKWYAFDDQIWRNDVKAAVPGYVQKVIVDIGNRLNRAGDTPRDQEKNATIARHLCSKRTMDAVLGLAKHDRRVIAQPEEFDRNPDLLGTLGGIVDLRTGELIDSSPDLMITKSTITAPKRGPCPLWTAYLEEATGGDKDLEQYLQHVAGYALTGHTFEQILFFFYGEGGRGKGTFINTLAEILGTYARTSSAETFMEQRFRSHPADLADLAGARMVTAQETREDQHWDEPRVKQLTGGDRISARFMGQDFFEYLPAFKLVFSGNKRPHIQDLDAAMRRRVHIVPFLILPKIKIQDLKEQLRGEHPAILQWAIDGAVSWRTCRFFDAPALVRAATDEYFSDEDPLGRWMDECCVRNSGESMRTSEAYESWAKWCDGMVEGLGSQKAFSVKMQARGLRKIRNGTGNVVFRGISLKKEEGDTWTA